MFQARYAFVRQMHLVRAPPNTPATKAAKLHSEMNAVILKKFFVEGLDELALVFLGIYKWAKYLSLASDSRDDLFPLQGFAHTNYDIKGGDFNDFFNEMLCNDISIWWHYYDNIRLSFYAHCAILAKNRNSAQRK